MKNTSSKKQRLFLTFCWIITWVQYSSASRSGLLLSQFQKKLDVFHSEIELLKYDVSDIQNAFWNLSQTCSCTVAVQNVLENQQVDNTTRLAKHETERPAQTDTYNTQYENNTAILAQCKTEIKAEINQFFSRLMKALHDEKKHTRNQVNDMLKFIHESKAQQQKFQSEVDEKIQEHENGVKKILESMKSASEQSLNDTLQQTDSKLEASERESENMMSSMFELLNATKEEISKTDTETENKIKLLEENIAQLKEKLTSMEDDKVVLKQTLENILNLIPFEFETMVLCAKDSETWTTNLEHKARFLVVNNLKSWRDASYFCRQHCSRLVELDSKEKNLFVYQLFKTQSLTWPTSSILDFWAGGSDILKEGEWKWKHSGRLLNEGYTNWRNLEPNNAGKGEHCLAVKEWDWLATWNDQDCSTASPFVCESKLL